MDKRRMCPHCRAFITTADRVCPYCDTPVGPRAIDRLNPGLVAGIIPHAQFATTIILLLNLGLYVATAMYSAKSGNSGALTDIDGRTLFFFGAKFPEAIAAGQWWRLITAGFLHGGLLHIFMNSWALYDVGSQVEQLYGLRRYLVIYFVATVGGFFASSLWSNALSVGASAGLFGLIGAMIALGVKHEGPAAAMVRQVYVRWAIYGLLFGFLPGLHVDNAAHIGGLACGFGLAYVAGLPRLLENWRERLWAGAALASCLLTALAFLKMYLWMIRL